jgi:hypothetical protein
MLYTEGAAQMPMLTLGQAAKMVGKSKPTISKAIADTKISAQKIDGIYQIELSELLRVFPAVSAEKAEASDKDVVSAVEAVEKRWMALKIDDLETRLSEMKSERDQAQREAREANTRVMALISDLKPKSFWSRIIGK